MRSLTWPFARRMAANNACVAMVPEPAGGSRTTEIGALPGAAIASFLGDYGIEPV